MAGNPAELVIKSQEKILTAPEEMASAETKRELLQILVGLAGGVIKDRELLHNLFSEIEKMGENYVFDLLMEKGIEKGARQEARQGILKVLARRFGEVPPELVRRINAIEELPKLESLLVEAAVCPNLEAFIPYLP